MMSHFTVDIQCWKEITHDNGTPWEDRLAMHDKKLNNLYVVKEYTLKHFAEGLDITKTSVDSHQSHQKGECCYGM